VVAQGLLLGGGRVFAAQVVRVSVVLVTACGFALLASLNALTVATATATYVAANVIAMLTALNLVAARDGRIKFFERKVARRMLQYGSRTQVGTVSLFLNERLDQLALSVFFVSAVLGAYVVAVSFASLAAIIGFSISLVAVPAIAGAATKSEAYTTLRRYLLLAVGISIGATIPLFVFAGPILAVLFGSEYAGASGTARLLLIGGILLSINRVLGAGLRALGSPGGYARAELLSLGVTVLMLAIFLPLWGSNGAALASVVAYATSSIWQARMLTQAFGLPTMRHLWLPQWPAVAKS
jgi:O-antigen/teichoic acid export membrane protein